MAIIRKEKYSPERVEKIHQYLQTYAEKGKPVEYEVLVDGFKAVRRTDDPEMFSMFESFVRADSESIEVLVYTGSSNYNDKYIFTFGEGHKETGLSGTEIESKIQDHVDKAKKQWEHELRIKENEELKKRVEELEDELDELEERLQKETEGKSPIQGMLGEMGSGFVTGMLKNNPKILENIPGLSGLIGGGSKQLPNPSSTEDTEVSFTAKTEGSDNNTEAQQALQFMGYLQSKLSADQFTGLMLQIDKMAAKPELIQEVTNFLKDK